MNLKKLTKSTPTTLESTLEVLNEAERSTSGPRSNASISIVLLPGCAIS